MTAFRKTLNLTQDTKEKMNRIAERKGVSASRVVDMAIDWLDRCETVQSKGRITKLEIWDPGKPEPRVVDVL